MKRLFHAIDDCENLIAVHLSDNELLASRHSTRLALCGSGPVDFANGVLNIFGISHRTAKREVDEDGPSFIKAQTNEKVPHLDYPLLIRRATIHSLKVRSASAEDHQHSSIHWYGGLGSLGTGQRAEADKVAEIIYPINIVHGDNEGMVAARYELLLNYQVKYVQ